MRETKEKLLNALESMKDGSNEAEIILTYSEVKEFLLQIELADVERKLRFEKLKEAQERYKKIKNNI